MIKKNSTYFERTIFQFVKLSDSYFDDLFLKVWQDQICINILCDLNNDGNINVLYVIQLVNLVLANQLNPMADFNNDNILNILNIVGLVDWILNN